MKLTHYFLKKKVYSLAAKAATRKHHFCTLKDAVSILVLYDAKNREVVEPCLETLRMMHKKVFSCVYVENEILSDLDNSYLSVSARKDLNVWYFPNEPTLLAVNRIKADLIIDLTNKENYVMQYLLLQHACPFKVGTKHTELDLYDLAISVTDRNDIKYLFGHILFYLQTICSK